MMALVMAKKSPAGRKSKHPRDLRTNSVPIYLTDAEYAIVREKAAAENLPLAIWARIKILSDVA